MEHRIAYLRPAEIAACMREVPVVYVPFGPLEWHGPHLPYGMDPLNAENAARLACEKTGGLIWPTQFWGTERERTAKRLKSLGFPVESYIVGMDFPDNSLPSMYCPEGLFSLLVREILREIQKLGAKAAVLVNGHGAENHIRVLERLTVEFNNTTPLRVHLHIALPESMRKDSIGHADAAETSIMMHLHPECVDIKQLPAASQPLKYTELAVVDAQGFDDVTRKTQGKVSDSSDPRLHASADFGKEIIEETVNELVSDVKKILNG